MPKGPIANMGAKAAPGRLPSPALEPPLCGGAFDTRLRAQSCRYAAIHLAPSPLYPPHRIVRRREKNSICQRPPACVLHAGGLSFTVRWSEFDLEPLFSYLTAAFLAVFFAF